MANSGTPANQVRLKIRNRLNDYTDDSWPYSSRTTDLEGWRIVVEEPLGRLKWKYLKTDSEREKYPQDTMMKFLLELPTSTPNFEPVTTPSQAILNGLRFHSNVQVRELGCWAANLSCILFVTPMLIITWYLTSAEIHEAHAIELVNYLFSVQSTEDGGWPTYPRQETTLMGTVLIYVALRLMGVPPEEEHMVKARECLLRMGGAAYVPSWAKFWLAMLGLCEWEGTDPYPAEIWLLPNWVPINPWRWWPIVRAVYLAMSYLSAKRFTIPSNALLDQIRTEIYTEPYESLDFASLRDTVLMCERHQPKSRVLNALNWTLNNIWYPWLCPKTLARKGEERAWEIIKQSNTNYNATGFISIDSFLNLIAFYCTEGPDSANVKRMQEISMEYLWMEKSGMQAMSIHAGHTWDTGFALQTYVHAGLATHFELKDYIQRVYKYLVDQQLIEDWPDSPVCHFFTRLGGWPFSTRYQGIACSDCGGEALKAILLVERETDLPKLTEEKNIHLAVDNLLLIQNASGGYSTWEPIRAGAFMEYLNGTELFGNVMKEHDFTECTSSCITALALFKTRDNYRLNEVNRAIDRGAHFIRQRQRADGSWLASWGIACTYGAFFALEALNCVGETYDNSSVVKQGCDFLLNYQMPDGGWGETIDSIFTGTYAQAKKSHTVQTAWCCLALMYAAYPDQEPIKRGIRLIISRQLSNGEWKQEGPVGSGIVTVEILYRNYLYSFPIRALSMYKQIYGDDPLLT